MLHDWISLNCYILRIVIIKQVLFPKFDKWWNYHNNLIIYLFDIPLFLWKSFYAINLRQYYILCYQYVIFNKNHNIDILQLRFLSVMRLWLLQMCYNMGIIHCNVGSMCHSSKWFLLPCLPLSLPLFVIILSGCF